MLEPAKSTTFRGNPDTRPMCDGRKCQNRGSIISDLWDGVLCGNCACWAWLQAKGQPTKAVRKDTVWVHENGYWSRSGLDWELQLESTKTGWDVRLTWDGWTSQCELSPYAVNQAKIQAARWAGKKAGALFNA
ncbi:MAG: hypothetical protein V3U60_16025 [Gammaproteobacteria bacterium]